MEYIVHTIDYVENSLQRRIPSGVTALTHSDTAPTPFIDATSPNLTI